MVTSTKPFTTAAELSRNRCHPTLTAKHLTKNRAGLLAINWNLLICRKHVTNLFKIVNSICPVPHPLTDQRVKFPLQKEWTGRRSAFLSHTSFSVWLNNAEQRRMGSWGTVLRRRPSCDSSSSPCLWISTHVGRCNFHVRSRHAITSQGSVLICRNLNNFFSFFEKKKTPFCFQPNNRGYSRSDWEQSTGNNIMLLIQFRQ